jgi:hypothetical protein
MKTILNIGLKTNSNEDVNKSNLMNDLNRVFESFSYKVKQSNTEPTLIVTTNEYLSDFQIQKLCDWHQQDCIAVMRGGKGTLVYGSNPKNDWGKFNQKYFISC